MTRKKVPTQKGRGQGLGSRTAALGDTVPEVVAPVQRLSDTVGEVSVPVGPGDVLPSLPYAVLIEELVCASDDLRDEAAHRLPQPLRDCLGEVAASSYQDANAFCEQVAVHLRKLRLAIAFPGTGEPAHLVAEPVPGSTACRLRLQADAHGEKRVDVPDKLTLVSVEPVLLQAEKAGALAGGLYEQLGVSAKGSWQDVAKQVLPALKDRLRAIPHETYEDKKKLTAWANAELGRFGLAVRCPTTGRPSVLVAGPGGKSRSQFFVQNRDEDGRQVRPFSTRDLETLMEHLEVVPADPRRQRWGKWALHASGGKDTERNR